MKALIRRLLENFVKQHGYVLMPAKHWHEYRKLSEQQKTSDAMTRCLQELVKSNGIDCVFDVGANDGGFVRTMRESVGYQGWIISFEALPDVAADLQRQAAGDPKWEVVCLAVGAEAGELAFHRMASDVFSSFLKPDASQPGKYNDSNKVVKSEMVKVETVNTLWPQFRQRLGATKLLLKSDTQGFDLKVFAGASQHLADIPVLVSELSCVRIYQDAPTYQESLQCYAASGYVPAMFVPISFDAGHAILEMDAVLVRKI